MTSGEEVAESEFRIAAKPSRNGFYEWVDTIVKDNGKKDCSGQITDVGRKTTNYVRFDPAAQRFVVCRAESLDACFGPLRRIGGEDIWGALDATNMLYVLGEPRAGGRRGEPAPALHARAPAADARRATATAKPAPRAGRTRRDRGRQDYLDSSHIMRARRCPRALGRLAPWRNNKRK